MQQKSRYGAAVWLLLIEYYPVKGSGLIYRVIYQHTNIKEIHGQLVKALGLPDLH